MDIVHFSSAHETQLLAPDAALPADGFLWFDIVREEQPQWHERIEQLVETHIHERHVKDSLNPAHPSFHDSTRDYDLLIFRGLAPDAGLDQLLTRPTAFFLSDNRLITVRPSDSVSVARLKARVLSQTGRLPRRPVELLHQLLSAMVDRFMALREPLLGRLETWRRNLLDPQNPFEDWMSVLQHTTYLRQLEMLCEEQQDAVSAWRDGSDVPFDDHLAVRFNDLHEHINRIRNFAYAQRSEVDSLIQMHFSAVAHRTNEVVRMLTVISAIFLPLTLIAGIFGMNFEFMPELKLPYGYFFALGGMAALAIVLLVVFRKKRWL